MAEDDTITNQISDIAAGPKSVSGDAGSVTQQDIGQLIEADRYLAAKRAYRRRAGFGGIRISRVVQPGAHGNG